MTGHKYKFSSVQYDLPPHVSNQIIDWGRYNIPEGALFNDVNDPTYGREDRIHCTIFFGIHTPRVEPVERVLRWETPFPITLGAVSYFTNCRFDVVKLEVFGNDLFRIHNNIALNLDSTETYKYCPHVTIAYVKKGTGHMYSGTNCFTGRKLWVSTLLFSSSSGNKYHIDIGTTSCLTSKKQTVIR
jgi:hypothetical protein